jgi:NADH-quinone oxidoreductase subunit L
MLVPLLALSVGAVAAGFVFAPYFIGHGEHEFWRGAVFVAPDNHVLHESHDVPTWVKWSPLVLTIAGSLFAFWLYVLKEGMARRMADRGGVVHAFLYNKWYFDELYDFLFVRPAIWLGRLFWKGGDEGTIDRFGPHGAAFAVGVGNRVTYRFQSGYLYSYALVMLLGLIGAASWAIWWASK